MSICIRIAVTAYLLLGAASQAQGVVHEHGYNVGVGVHYGHAHRRATLRIIAPSGRVMAERDTTVVVSMVDSVFTDMITIVTDKGCPTCGSDKWRELQLVTHVFLRNKRNGIDAQGVVLKVCNKCNTVYTGR